MTARVLPTALDAEASVLSASLGSVPARDECRVILGDGEAFYADANRLVWQAISGVSDSGAAVDVVSVVEWLRARGKLERVGGTPYVGQLLDATPATAHAADHARIVRDLGAARGLVGQMQELIARAYTGIGDARAWLDECESAVFAATERPRETPAGEAVGDIALRVYRDAGKTSRGELKAASSTGLLDLDEHTGGLAVGNLWYVAGRPGMGKSGLAWGFLESVAAAGELAVLFSVEMPREEVVQRALARGAWISSRRVARGELTPGEWNAVAVAMKNLQTLPIMIDDTQDITPALMRSRVRRYIAEGRKYRPGIRLGVIGVDYLGLLDDDQEHGTENDRLTSISRKLKKMAREFECCVVCMAQLNREVEKRDKKDKRPSLEHLRGSGAIEQDGDVILFVYRDEYYFPDTDQKGVAELLIAKGRSSGNGTVWTRFDGPTTSFRPYNEQPVQQGLYDATG